MTDHGRTPNGDAADAAYRSLLAELSAPPRDAVDWDALHRRIEDAAALPLARLRNAAARPEPVWWELTARRARALLPLAVAASLAMFAYVQQHPVYEERTSVDARDAYAAAVTGGASSSGVTRLLVASGLDADASVAR